MRPGSTNRSTVKSLTWRQSDREPDRWPLWDNLPTMKAKYAGHSALFLYDSDFVSAIDPWLDGNPLCPDDLKNPSRIDLIVLTHGHSDHAGDAVRLQKLTGAKVAATFELAMIMIQEGVPGEAVIPMNKGGTAVVGRYRVTLTHAFHSSSYDSPTRGTLY